VKADEGWTAWASVVECFTVNMPIPPTQCDPMMAEPSGGWNVFKQIFADHRDKFKHAYPLPAMWCGQASGVDEPQIVFVLVIHEGEASMKEEVTDQLKAVFQKVLEEKDITITREMTAQDIEKWDSLRHIQLISEVERAFGIKFKLREVLSMKNVGDLIDLIHAKQALPNF